MTEELKPCPFCGGEAKKPEETRGHKNDGWWSIECGSCGVSISGEWTAASTITAWNTRPSAAPIGAEPGSIAAVFDEGLVAQAQRLGIAPMPNETPGQHRDRVRRAAMLAAASSEGPQASGASAGPGSSAVGTKAAAHLRPSGNDPSRDALRAALDHYERNICHHDETHRGGFLWTICDQCGAKWADDEGGFQPFAYPPEIERAFDVLARMDRDRAASLAEDAERLSPEGVAARAEGIAKEPQP